MQQWVNDFDEKRLVDFVDGVTSTAADLDEKIVYVDYCIDVPDVPCVSHFVRGAVD